MDFRFAPSEEEFRQEVREFLAQELPRDWPDAYTREVEREAVSKALRKKLARKGWLTLAWPKEYGGQARSVVEQLIFNEEMGKRSAPMGGGMGVLWVGPMIMLYGTEEQKKSHLPAMAADEVVWCTLYSEPNAGSDLASLQTRATLEGDFFVVNGHKVWTTEAHHADWGLLACRTDSAAEKHKGISLLLLDMKSPGLTVKPLPDMTEDVHFNEEILDSVRVPRNSLLGKLNQGWYQMAVGLQFERSWINQVLTLERYVADLIEYARKRGAGSSPVVRQKLADLAVRCQVGRMLGYRVVWVQSRGGSPSYESSVDKLFNSEGMQYAARVGMELLGLHSQLARAEPRAPLKGRVQANYRDWVGYTIGGGTSEVQRNIIAQRGLGLPR